MKINKVETIPNTPLVDIEVDIDGVIHKKRVVKQISNTKEKIYKLFEKKEERIDELED